MSRLTEYLKYHFLSYGMHDIDPGYPLLLYVCDRYELNPEQRYWLAFLYACTYCAASVFYIYNEFPDFENVNVARLARWWSSNRERVIFQTDRRWIRSNNQFVDVFTSYTSAIHTNGYGQADAFHNLSLRANRPTTYYDLAYDYFQQVKYFGRFALFLYLEAVHVVTGENLEPSGLDLEQAQSSCNGLCYALGRDSWLQGQDYPSAEEPNFRILQGEYEELVKAMKKVQPGARVDAWNVETTLCAYKKYKRGHRYPGYYLDRQLDEIEKMEDNITRGVDWSVLYQFREERLDRRFLKEKGARNRELAEERLAAYDIRKGLSE